MSTLLDAYAPFDSGPGANVTESTWRSFASAFRPDGVVANSCNVFGDSSGMQVKVDVGELWIKGAWGQSTLLKALPVTSNSTGSTRIDLVVARNDFNANTIAFDVITGTTVAPALTQNTSVWEIQLGVVNVPNGAVTISAANVVFTPQNGEAWYTTPAFTALVGITYVMNFSAIVSGTVQSADIVPSNNASFGWTSVGSPTNSPSGTLNIKRGGIWSIEVSVNGCPFSTGAGATLTYIKPSGNTGTTYLGQTGSNCTEASAPVRLTAGTALSVFFQQNTGSTQAGLSASIKAIWLRA